MRIGAALALLMLLSPVAQAHIASNGFLVVQVQGQQLRGSIELAVRDVELAIGVDANRDGKVTWGELRAGAPRLMQYVAAASVDRCAGQQLCDQLSGTAGQ